MATRGEKQKEDWMNSKWRPAMGWMYMLTCVTDFVIFPILWSLVQALLKQPVTQWSPLTLQGAGLFHLAMGAVLGVAAYGRTQEKLGGANNGGISAPTTGFAPGLATTSTPSTGFGAASGGFGSPAPSGSFTPAVAAAPAQTFGSGPPAAQKPEL